MKKAIPEFFSDRFRAYRRAVVRLRNKSGLARTSFVSPSGLFGKKANEINRKEKLDTHFLRSG